MKYFNLLLKTLIEGTIVIYASGQVIAWVLARGGDEEEGEKEEHCLRDLGQVGRRELGQYLLWMAFKLKFGLAQLYN